MLITKQVGKMETVFYALNSLDESLFSVSDTEVHEDTNYQLSTTVRVNITEDQLPEDFMIYDFRDQVEIKGTPVSYSFVLETCKGLSFDIHFSASLFLSSRRSEAGRQLIRDTVTAEFGKINFIEVSKQVVESHLSRRVASENEREAENFKGFLRFKSAKKADDLLNEQKNPEWQHLAKQEEQLKALLEAVMVRQSVLRKEALIASIEKDERAFSDNTQALVNDRLINVEGIRYETLFSYE